MVFLVSQRDTKRWGCSFLILFEITKQKHRVSEERQMEETLCKGLLNPKPKIQSYCKGRTPR